jgi:hypothetical protein
MRREDGGGVFNAQALGSKLCNGNYNLSEV